jgi:uncharacterized protein YqeY
MPLADRITQDLKDAMKSGERTRVDVFRLLKAQIKNKEIEIGGALSEQEEIQILKSAVKRRKESIEMYKQGGREDLFDKESRELDVIKEYLPKPFGSAELEEIVSRTIADLNASSLKDMGQVIKAIMSEYPGRADGKEVQRLVREKLS